MKKLFLLLLVLSNCILFTSCEWRKEIEDITFIKVIGIDQGINNTIQLTVTSKFVPDENSAEETGAYVTVTGETIFDAVRNLNKLSTKRPFWGHTEYIIFGENLAKDGIMKYLDFFSRQYQFRLNTNILVAKDSTAEKVIKQTSLKGIFISERLSYLTEKIDGISVSHDVKLHDLLEMFDRPFNAPYIPCIYLTKLFHDDENENKNDIELNGYFIFKDNKMIGYIKDDLSKGLNWVRDQYKSGIIVVKDHKGGKVSLEIIDGKTKIIPQHDQQDNLSVHIKIQVISSIGEMYSNEDIFNETTFDYLEKQQQTIVKKQAEEIIKYAQQNKADFLNIWQSVFHKYPNEFKNNYKEWPDIFAKLPIHVDVESKIIRTYLKKQPLASQEVKN